MSNELKTGETVALVAAELRGHVCALADEYGGFLRQDCAGEAGKDAAGAAAKAKLDPREFQARHAAGKAALAHMELLLKLARAIDGDPELLQESEAALEAEAARNLERPA